MPDTTASRRAWLTAASAPFSDRQATIPSDYSISGAHSKVTTRMLNAPVLTGTGGERKLPGDFVGSLGVESAGLFE